MKEELKAASGALKADMHITNIQILDVYTETLYPGSLVIRNGRIVASTPEWRVQKDREYDGGGAVAVPGFMDAHVHIETTLLTPEALADVIVPWGTTTLFVDAMEIANVIGIRGLRTLLNSNADLPYRCFMEVPSRVPTAPGLETTGGVLGIAEVSDLLDDDIAVSLGELDPEKVLNLKDEYLEKILAAHGRGKICNGHAIGLDWDHLNIYATAGLTDDHESVAYRELFERLRLGIKPLIREGSTERNVDTLVRGVVEHRLPTDDMMFCTDDKHVNDIAREGHISYNIQRAIDLGLPPIKAIKMATLNAARHFRLDHQLGSLSPGRFADLVLLPDLNTIKPLAVFKDGVPTAENGVLLKSGSGRYPDFLYTTVHIAPDFKADDFRIPAGTGTAKARIINLYSDQIINHETVESVNAAEGGIQVDISRDILKLSVIERYGKNGQVASALVRGFKLKSGAIASSVSHDHHNIVVVGTNDDDMYRAVRELEKHQGGFVAVDGGAVLGVLSLPIAGLMSPLSADRVMQQMEELNHIVQEMGSDLPAPFMTLSFVSLPTVPALGLTDRGLIDVMKHEIVPVVLPA